MGQPCPNHVKIDVDGSEPQVIAGMKKTLADTRLKSIAIELDPKNRPADKEILDTIQACGFELLTGTAYMNVAYQSWTQVRNYFLVRPEYRKPTAR